MNKKFTDPSRDDPVDLAPVAFDRHPDAEERFVRAVMSRIDAAGSMPENVGPFAGVALYSRFFAIAASLIVLITGAEFLRQRADSGSGPRTVAEAIGVPPEFLFVGSAVRSPGAP